MAVGPIQVIVVGFDTIEKMRGEALRELANLRGRGVIRVVDLLAVKKDASGAVTKYEQSDLTAAEQAEFGKFMGLLLGLGAASESGGEPLSSGTALDAVEKTVGLNLNDVNAVIDKLEPGHAAAVLVVEHTWAIGLRDAIRNAGGVPLAQGFLTPESLMLVGKELEAMAQAKQAIEVAETVKGAAVLDALVTVAQAEAIKEEAAEEAVEAVVAAELIKTAAAAEAVRALIAADIIEKAAAQEALEALQVAGLIEAAALEEANQRVAEAAAEDKEPSEAAKSETA